MKSFAIGDKVKINNFTGAEDSGVIVGEPMITKCAEVCVDLEGGKNPSTFKFWCVRLDSTGATQNLCEEHLSKQ